MSENRIDGVARQPAEVMSKDLIDSVAPQLAAPVTREAVHSATEADGGTTVSVPVVPLVALFADDDAE